MRLIVAGLCLLGACTEPNPFAQMDTEDATTTGAATLSTSTTTAEPGPSSTSADTTSSSTSASTSTEDTSAGPSTSDEPMPDTPVMCPAGSMCVAEAPADWNGPVSIAVTDVGAEPSCGGDYPEAALGAFDDLNAPPAECECSCGAVSGASCTNPTLEYHANDSVCAGAPNDDWTVTTGCVPVSAPGADYWLVEPPEITGGDCTPNVLRDDVPPWSWDTAVTTCSGMFGNIGCDAGSLCARLPERPFDPSICIWREDAVTCPEGPYTDRRIYYTEVSDTRGCSGCGCDDPEGTCAGLVYLFGDSSCTELVLQVNVNGNCVLHGNNFGTARARWSPGTITASCDSSGGESMGLAAGAGRYTVCCLGV